MSADPFVTKLDPFERGAQMAAAFIAAGNQNPGEAALPGAASSGQVPEGGYDRRLRAEVTDAGGGEVNLLIDRGAEEYPSLGTSVLVTWTDGGGDHSVDHSGPLDPAAQDEEKDEAAWRRWVKAGRPRGADGKPVDVPAPHCAYDRCQAGGDILDGAPRVENADGPYHPGCDVAAFTAWNEEQKAVVAWSDCEAINPEGLVLWGDGRP